MAKKKSKYQFDKDLLGIDNVSSLKQVADDQEAYQDILKDAKITRIANKGDKFITQNITYDVSEIEVDWDSIVYKYEYEGKEYFSNFLFANPKEVISPKYNKDESAEA